MYFVSTIDPRQPVSGIVKPPLAQMEVSPLGLKSEMPTMLTFPSDYFQEAEHNKPAPNKDLKQIDPNKPALIPSKIGDSQANSPKRQGSQPGSDPVKPAVFPLQGEPVAESIFQKRALQPDLAEDRLGLSKEVSAQQSDGKKQIPKETGSDKKETAPIQPEPQGTIHATKKTQANQSKPDEIPKEPEKQPSETSKLVRNFKLIYAAVVAGLINTFLFGSRFWVATTLAVGFAASQTYMALKIEREDTKVTRSLLKFSRRVTGTEKDKTPKAQEKAMALVWGSVAAALATVESGLNDLLKKGTPEAIQKETIARLKKEAKFPNIFGGIAKLQLKSIELQNDLKKTLNTTTPRAGNVLVKGVLNGLSRSGKIAQQRPYNYLLSAAMAFVGGYIQASLASNLQAGINNKNNAKLK